MTRFNIRFYTLLGCLVLGAMTIIVPMQASAQTNDIIKPSTLVAGSDSSAIDNKLTRKDRSQPAVPSPSPSSSWTGFYVGAYAGGNFGRATANTSTVFTPTGYFATTSVPAIGTSGRQKLSPNGFTGGGTVGYNHQSGSWVLGAEADFGALTGNKTVSTTTTYPCCSPTTFTVTQSVKTRWLFTARPRVGYAAGNSLFYVTGGLAVTDIKYRALFTDTFATAAESGGESKNKAGWTAGGGIEYKMNSAWSVKGEYLFAQFGRVTSTSSNLTAFTPPIAFPSNTFTHSIYLTEHMVRFGVNYRF